MVATRFAHPVTREPPSLYWSNQAGPTLSRKYEGHPDGPSHASTAGKGKRRKKTEHGKHVIIASEPTTFDAQEWLVLGLSFCRGWVLMAFNFRNLIEANNMLAVGKGMEMSITKV